MKTHTKESQVSGLRSQVSSLRGLTIGIIGTGTMGQALIKGLLGHGVSRRLLYAADPSAARRQAVARRFAIRVGRDNAAAGCGADVVLLAVKPQQMPQVIAGLAPLLMRRQLLISIAAGIPLRWFEKRVKGVPVIRVMPNLPATIGSGFSALAYGRTVTGRHRAMARALFGAVGEVVELPERHFDAVTAVSGSGPAYVFFLAQVWEDAARRLGLPPAVAARAIHQTLKGSVRLLECSAKPAARLVTDVASRGGTTEAALRVLAKRSVPAHVAEALRAAARRSKELSWA